MNHRIWDGPSSISISSRSLRHVSRRPAFALALVAVSMLLAGCDLAREARCALGDPAAAMRSGDAAARGQALECLLAKSPEQIEPFVPLLLERVVDGAVYRRVWSGGGLVGFGEAGEREVSVAQVAIAALRKARPEERSVAPIARAMVANAGRMRGADGVGLYGEPGTAALVLADLLTREYRAAGLGPVVDAALARELPGLRRAQTRRWLEASLYPAARPVAAAQPAPATARDGAHGLTWGLAAPGEARGEPVFDASCHGEPKAPMDRLHNGSCNPYVGDTACDAALPLLCYAPVARELRTTAPVAGRALSDRAAADAHCQGAFGPQWRMAEHHDGDWGLRARGTPPAPATRFWVAIRDQPGNCWDSR
jgi:hypothetical protein